MSEAGRKQDRENAVKSKGDEMEENKADSTQSQNEKNEMKEKMKQ